MGMSFELQESVSGSRPTFCGEIDVTVSVSVVFVREVGTTDRANGAGRQAAGGARCTQLWKRGCCAVAVHEQEKAARKHRELQ
jgi:hypothetical protein